MIPAAVRRVRPAAAPPPPGSRLHAVPRGPRNACRARLLLPALGFVVLLLGVASLGLGRMRAAPQDVAGILAANLLGASWLDPDRLRALQGLVMEVRLPRVLGALLVGASLSVSGAAYQALFVNPLVCPGLLGVLSGASFGAVLGMVTLGSWGAVQLSTLAGGLLAVLLALGIAWAFRAGGPLVLVLAGTISGALFSALISMVKYAADPHDKLPSIVFWLMGNLSVVDRPSVTRVVVPMILGLAALLCLARPLNALSLGDEEARALGVPVGAVRAAVIAAATVVSTLTVVLAGNIAWIGLIVPHLARLLLGADNERVLPASALLGAGWLLLVDDAARVAFPFEVPTGILTALLGVPLFALMARSVRRRAA